MSTVTEASTATSAATPTTSNTIATPSSSTESPVSSSQLNDVTNVVDVDDDHSDDDNNDQEKENGANEKKKKKKKNKNKNKKNKGNTAGNSNGNHPSTSDDSAFDDAMQPLNLEDDMTPSPAETEAIKAKQIEILRQLSSSSTSAQVQLLLNGYTNELQTRVVLSRQNSNLRDRLIKVTNINHQLTSLAKNLNTQNTKLSAEIERLSSMESQFSQSLKTRFESTLADIQTQMADYQKERDLLIAENKKLRDGMEQLLTIDQARTEHMNKQIQSKDLEKQIAEAKLLQAEGFVKESEKHIQSMQKNEKALRAELSQYAAKFADVQSTLGKSNELFGTFKTEMDKMQKTLRTYEKDKAESNALLVTMRKERLEEANQLQTAVRKGEKMAALCMELEKQKKAEKMKIEKLMSFLKEKNIEVPEELLNVNPTNAAAAAQPANAPSDTPAATSS